MKTSFLAFTVAVALAPANSGCTTGATPFHAPTDVARIQLERGDSRNVIVDKIWLERENGPLAVCGYVLKRLRGDDTDRTQLEVTLLDGSGAVLRRTTGHFSPQHLVCRRGRPALASYHVELGEVPSDTARITVRAYDSSDGPP